MIDLYYKPKRKLKGIPFDEDDIKEFNKFYPKLLTRACNRLVKLCIQNRHFLENVLFSEIDVKGNFTEINYPHIVNSTK